VVREGDWKLIYHHADECLELFKLSEDIGEQNDLSKEYADKTGKMTDLLTKLLKETDAQMPVVKATE